VSYYAFTDGLDQLKESASGTDGHLSDNAKKIIYVSASGARLRGCVRVNRNNGACNLW